MADEARYYTREELLARGWPYHTIRRLLGPPDAAGSRPAKGRQPALYRAARVESMERTEAFQLAAKAARERRRLRRGGASPGSHETGPAPEAPDRP